MRPLLITLYLAGVALVVFAPQPVDSGAAGFLDGALALFHGWGGPQWVSYGFIEFSANIVMFLPFGFLCLYSRRDPVRPVRGILLATAAALAVSAGIELVQLQFLPARFASGADVLANTAGALLGAAAAAALNRSRCRPPPPTRPQVPGSNRPDNPGR